MDAVDGNVGASEASASGGPAGDGLTGEGPAGEGLGGVDYARDPVGFIHDVLGDAGTPYGKQRVDVSGGELQLTQNVRALEVSTQEWTVAPHSHSTTTKV